MTGLLRARHTGGGVGVWLKVMPDRRDHRSRLMAQNDVLGWFLRQPTLRVTSRQVSRLCGLKLDTSRRILDSLMAMNTVGLDAGGRYYLHEGG